MQSKEERGIQWLGDRANTESGQAKLHTALLMHNYIQSVTNLGMIKEAFTDSFNSELFIRLDIFNARERGAVLFAKLTVDEALEQLQSAGNEHLRNALQDLSEITGKLFNTKIPSTADVRKLLQIVNNILDLDNSLFTDKALATNLLFTLFLILNLGEPTLQSLSSWTLKAVSWVIPIAEIRESIATLLQKAEAKALILIPKTEEADELNVVGFAQSYFNQRCLSLLTEQPPDEQLRNNDEFTTQKRLVLVEETMAQTSAGLLSLLSLRSSNHELGLRIKSLKAFLDVVVENESRVSGRMYFLDLVANNAAAYQILLTTLPQQKKNAFETMVKHLTIINEKKNLTQQMSYGLSWLAVPVTHGYRYVTPQKIQDAALTWMPSTWDSECKGVLKQSLIDTLDELNGTLQSQQEEITRINNQLFLQDNDLKRQILSESDEGLLQLQQTVTLAARAVHTYQALLHSMKKNQDFLHKYQANAETLGHFIQIHNSFWVKLSNFFAQICWLFKTDAARMLDTVTQCKTKLDDLNAKYQEMIDSSLKKIDQNENVDASIKRQLREQFKMEMEREERIEPRNRPTGERSIRLLVKSLDRLFATNPQPLTPALDVKECIDDVSCELLNF
ncbi:hypothetical protein [Legionella rowbothamii]|uniref:hypothetical protein n=1 Tax=Legionella rowbothamii TaxID=96229 RepID=UPI0010556D08|nr:hypothetical protein [Legionella rowbothamii]